MMLVLGVYTLFSFLYVIFLGRVRKAWWSLRQANVEQPASVSFPFVTVIVPVRNEAQHLPDLLNDLLAQDCPDDRWELIVVNDGSADGTAAIAADFFHSHPNRGGLLNLPDREGGSKKQAVAMAIANAKGEWILTTDGDCRVGPSWLTTMAQGMSPGRTMLAGPVNLVGSPDFLGRLQTAEWIGLQCIGAAGIYRGRNFFCNGANLAYRKQAFTESGGFTRSKKRLSGDDTDLLLQFSRSWPGSIGFQSGTGAIVETFADDGIGSAFSQRHRWASKIPVALTTVTLLISLIAWLSHAGFLAALCIMFFSPIAAFVVLPVFFLKVLAEYLLLKDGADYFGHRVSFGLILAAQPFYALYITLVGAAAVFLPYTWKGRKGR